MNDAELKSLCDAELRNTWFAMMLKSLQNEHDEEDGIPNTPEFWLESVVRMFYRTEEESQQFLHWASFQPKPSTLCDAFYMFLEFLHRHKWEVFFEGPASIRLMKVS